jgi:uncharacterized protein with FMN-binding domain
MRRALLTLTGVMAATTVLVALKCAPGALRTPEQVRADTAAHAPLRPAPADPGAPAPTAPGPSRPTASHPAPAPTPSRAPVAGSTVRPPHPGAPTTTTAPPRSSTVTGDSAFTEFGYVTVRITVASGRITDVTAVELPGDEPRSVSISERVGPLLRQEALTAQSAHIDAVSGATWTSQAYRESLQSALDKAGLG